MKNLIFLFSLVIIIGIGFSGCQDKAPPGKMVQDEFAMRVDQPSYDVQYAVMLTETQTKPSTPVMRESLPVTLASMEGGDGEAPPAGKWWLNYAIEIVCTVLFFLYEIIARRKPTSRSLSIITNLLRLINWFVPDKAEYGKKFDIKPVQRE
jgi:hypothetical protein